MSLQGWQPFVGQERRCLLLSSLMPSSKTKVISRVPSSHSNPADGVSRLLRDLPISLGAEQTTIGWERCRSLVDEVGIGAGGSEGRPKC